jgi:hypothetical protein
MFHSSSPSASACRHETGLCSYTATLWCRTYQQRKKDIWVFQSFEQAHCTPEPSDLADFSPSSLMNGTSSNEQRGEPASSSSSQRQATPSHCEVLPLTKLSLRSPVPDYCPECDFVAPSRGVRLMRFRKPFVRVYRRHADTPSGFSSTTGIMAGGLPAARCGGPRRTARIRRRRGRLSREEG